ncbi:hypothetical protein V462_12965 [Pantoea ananatis 15320]|nr:hypothetical protein V462_12965 [Pantoea ananatis 15320]
MTLNRNHNHLVLSFFHIVEHRHVKKHGNFDSIFPEKLRINRP